MVDRIVHIRVPVGVVSKDGPSVGVIIYTVIATLLLKISACKSVVMTDEITLCGLVLPISSVRKNTLAASRAGIRTCLLPKKNVSDLEEVDDDVRKKCCFVLSEDVGELLEYTLEGVKRTRVHKKRSR